MVNGQKRKCAPTQRLKAFANSQGKRGSLSNPTSSQLRSMDKLPLLTRSQKRKTMTPAALAQRPEGGLPKGGLSLSDITFRDRCRVRDEEHIAILEDIAENAQTLATG